MFNRRQLASTMRCWPVTKFRIPAILVKGAHIAAAVDVDPVLRPMYDVGLLVRMTDPARARVAIVSLGFDAKPGEEVDVLMSCRPPRLSA